MSDTSKSHVEKRQMSERPRASGLSGDLGEHSVPLYRFALTITRDPQLTADLVQDTFVRALERSDQYRGEAPLRAWLRQILHNLAIDRARRAAREIVVEDVEENWHDDAYTVDPAAVAERTLTRKELEDGLARLPFTYRVVVILHDVEEWTVRQIAEVQDISLPAAKQRLRRGRMSLVSALAEGHERRKHWKECRCAAGTPDNTSLTISTAHWMRQRHILLKPISRSAPPALRYMQPWSERTRVSVPSMIPMR